jgi:hypothetical protein
MESLMLGLEEELRAVAQAAVQGVVARTRQEVQRVLKAALRYRRRPPRHLSGHAAQPSGHNAGRQV